MDALLSLVRPLLFLLLLLGAFAYFVDASWAARLFKKLGLVLLLVLLLPSLVQRLVGSVDLFRLILMLSLFSVGAYFFREHRLRRSRLRRDRQRIRGVERQPILPYSDQDS